jgi:hypothetical protein
MRLSIRLRETDNKIVEERSQRGAPQAGQMEPLGMFVPEPVSNFRLVRAQLRCGN